MSCNPRGDLGSDSLDRCQGFWHRRPLGFGDLSPAVGLPQALTAVEALLGQVFLVTLVARLVTLWDRHAAANQ
jgi:hypothetical protein